MALETLLGFGNIDSTEQINARLSGLIPKGVVKGGNVVPEPASLQVRIIGTAGEPWVMVAFSADGMVIRELSEEHVLPVSAGITNVIVLRAKYVDSGAPVSSLEVMSLGAYLDDPEQASLIRLASVSPATNSTAVLAEDINSGFRDEIEGFTRRIVREVVNTKEDLPAVSGFPAEAEINFLGNDFSPNSTITIEATSGPVQFTLVPAVSFSLADPSVPGLSRVNPNQKSIIQLVQNPSTGIVTVSTFTPHGYTAGQWVRISDTSDPRANQKWFVISALSNTFTFQSTIGQTPIESYGKSFAVQPVDITVSTSTFQIAGHGLKAGTSVMFSTTGTLPSPLNDATTYYIINPTSSTFQLSASAGTWNGSVYTAGPLLTLSTAGTGDMRLTYQNGSVVDDITPAIVTAKLATGVRHDFVSGSNIIISGAAEPTFNGPFTVVTVIDEQTFQYYQYSYPTRETGNGKAVRANASLSATDVEIGESDTVTASNFKKVFEASTLAPDILIRAIGSSLQLEAAISGSGGNAYTLSKVEPNYTSSQYQIVLSGANFIGGVDAVQGSTTISLQAGDIYVVLFGEMGTLELWGYDGAVFRNLTSASTATLLDFHRRNQFINEKHLAENEKLALVGTVGIPSATNRYVTEQDTSVLSQDQADALEGADNSAPNAENRFLTEARWRSQRGDVVVPLQSPVNPLNPDLHQNWVQLPIVPPEGRWVVGGSNQLFNNENVVLQYFNVVKTATLLDAGGPTEYVNKDFSPITVDALFVSTSATVPPSWVDANELTSDQNHSSNSDPLNYGYHNWVDVKGVFPRLDASVLGKPQYLWAKLNAQPDNGDCTVLYSAAVQERYRQPESDTLAGPQRIVPAILSDIANRVQELRFNSGVSLSGTTTTFPAGLFAASNIQQFMLRRAVAGKFAKIVDQFTFDLSSGIGTGPIENWSSLTWLSKLPSVGQWTRFLFVLAQSPTAPNGQTIRVLHVGDYAEHASDTAYSLNPANVMLPSMPFLNGEWLFASVLVQGAVTGIHNLIQSDVELYPYQQSPMSGAAVIVGDGTSSFGHFTGHDAFVRALTWAPSGTLVKVLAGTYVGHATVGYTKSDITVDNTAGGIFTAPADTALTVIGDRFKGLSLRFDSANIGIDVQSGADGLMLNEPTFTGNVVTRIKPPSVFTILPSNINTTLDTITHAGHGLANGASVVLSTTNTLPSGITAGQYYLVSNVTSTTFQLVDSSTMLTINFTDGGVGQHTVGTGKVVDSQIFNRKQSIATWTVTDGTATLPIVGDFNSPNGIQQAHDAAAAGDLIVIYPGSYLPVIISQSSLTFYGQAGAGVIINGGTGGTCLTVTGSFNQFDNLVLEAANGTGVDCNGNTAIGNTFGSNVSFMAGMTVNIKYPVNLPSRHLNWHQTTTNPPDVVTVGDGVNSWGDYNGSGAINQALLTENPGMKIRVGAGVFSAITINKDRMSIEGVPAGPNTTGLATVIDSNATGVIGHTFTNISVDIVNNVITYLNHGFPEGANTVLYSTGTLPSPLVQGTVYYIKNATTSTFQLSLTSGGTPIDLTNGGTGFHTIQVTLPGPSGSAQCIQVNGSFNRIKSLFLLSTNNASRNLSTYGVYVAGGDWNLIEDLNWKQSDSDRIDSTKLFYIKSGSWNKFTPHTGGLTGDISLTVGDGVRSFGDFNQDILAAVNAISTNPRGTGILTGATLDNISGNQADITIGLTTFDPSNGKDPATYTTWRNITLSGSTVVGQVNNGSYRIVEYYAPNKARIERLDGVSFVAESELTWSFLAGSKIWVLPGTYPPLTLNNNDMDIEAWGAGSDTIISGTSQPVLMHVTGNRCRVKGFRFASGLAGCVGVQVTGDDNVFEDNRFETDVRYHIESIAGGDSRDALRNRILDSYEDYSRMGVVVSGRPSRGDFAVTASVNATQAIQDAVDAVNADPHLKRIVLGGGDFVLTAPITLPAGVIVAGSGKITRLVGDGTFPCFQLASGGGQTVTGIFFDTFSYSLKGPAADIQTYANWFNAAPIDPTVLVIYASSPPPELPPQGGNGGRLLMTDGVNPIWAPTVAPSGLDVFLTTDGSSVSWADPLPNVTGNEHKVLTVTSGVSTWSYTVETGNSGWLSDTLTTVIPHGLSAASDICNVAVQELDTATNIIRQRNQSELVLGWDATNINLDWAGLSPIPSVSLQYRVVYLFVRS